MVPLRLVLLFVSGLLLLSGCRDGARSAALVEYIQPSPTPAATAGFPTPTPVPTELILSTEEVGQAGAVLVSVTGPLQAGRVTFLGRATRLARGSQSLYAFVGVGVSDPTGPQPLRVDFTLENGTTGSYEASIRVVATAWTVDSVEFTQEQRALLAPEIVADEAEVLARAYGAFSPAKLWSGPWQPPVGGGVTAQFGEQRSVNGGPPAGHHSGTDFGADKGSEVYAANSGTVVMARELAIRGNMVIVDHGGGVFTGYAHLDQFLVREGDPVASGGLIGLVGSTGLSTGAHLHWEMSVGGVLVNPLWFVDGSNGF